MFKKKNMDSFEPIYKKHVEILRRVISSNESQQLEMQALFNNFTLQTFCEIAFDYKVDLLTEENEFRVAFEACTNGTTMRMLNPFKHFFPLFKSEKNLAKNLEICNKIIFEIIDLRNSLRESGREWKRDDILGLYMSSKDEQGRDFSRNYLRDVCFNFLVAGKSRSFLAKKR